MTNFIIPSIVLFIVWYGFYKKIDIYNEFLIGVKEGLKMALNLFPTIFTMLVAINILTSSNLLQFIAGLFAPILDVINFPTALLPIALMRPVSGSSSLLLLNNIFTTYGVDSYIGKVASVIQGSTDTTIYILGLYFSSIGIKKTRYALFVGLITDLITIIISIIVINLLF